MSQLSIGVDLGTSNSCVATVGPDGPHVIRSPNGESTQASVVHFKPDGSVLVGNAAKEVLLREPSATVASSKRLIGRSFDSEEVAMARRGCAYDITESHRGVRFSVAGRDWTPQDIAGFILKEMRTIAEKGLRHPVSKAVITVPAYFNDNQRQATKDAARIAGLDAIRVINEPTAAALAYGFGKEMDKRVAIYDLGGGTFDISILYIGDDIFEVLATAGNTFLGGDDIDQRIVEHLLKEFKNQRGVDVSKHPAVFNELKQAAEQAKKALSEQDSTKIELSALLEDGQKTPHHLEITMTRDDLEWMCLDLTQKTFEVCDQAIQQAGIRKQNLDGVIMVGGPTRLPVVRQGVRDYFGQEPAEGVNPDHVVALGAALQAHQLVNGGGEAMLLDVTPLTLRLGTVEGLAERIIAKNTPIPIESTRKFTTASDNQTMIAVRVFQGESNYRSECELLSEFAFEGLRPAPRGEVTIDVTFEIDANGIVHVTACDTETGRSASTTIRLSSGMTEAEIKASHAVNEATALDMEAFDGL